MNNQDTAELILSIQAKIRALQLEQKELHRQLRQYHRAIKHCQVRLHEIEPFGENHKGQLAQAYEDLRRARDRHMVKNNTESDT